jgi:hypothetical protein
VRIVAIDAGDDAFSDPVAIGFLETCEHVAVAGSALFVNAFRTAEFDALGFGFMNAVATAASDLRAGMPAGDATHLRHLIFVAGEALLLGFADAEFGGILDVGRGDGLSVFRAGSVAGLARALSPAATFIDFDDVMAILVERLHDIFMASGAGLGADVTVGEFLRRDGTREEEDPGQEEHP